MKIQLAARLTFAFFLIAFAFTMLFMQPALRINSVLLPRQSWIEANSLLWQIGCWLWMPALFTWMLLLITLMWFYLPGYRISAMLQSGLILISATLAVAAISIWMIGIPRTIAQSQDIPGMVALIDGLVLALFGASFLMGGAVTAWIALELARFGYLNWIWVAPSLIAGVLAMPSAFLLPTPYLLLAAGLFWLLWCAMLSLRSAFPNAYPEWT